MAKKITRVSVSDAEERGRIQRARRAAAQAGLEVDAEMVVRLIESGSAPALLGGELLARIGLTSERPPAADEDDSP